MVTILQITAAIFSIYSIINTINLFYKKKIGIIKMLFWNAIWIGILIMSFAPGIISRLTGTNPADLVIRISIITLFYIIFTIEVKINEMKKEITTLKEAII